MNKECLYKHRFYLVHLAPFIIVIYLKWGVAWILEMGSWDVFERLMGFMMFGFMHLGAFVARKIWEGS